MTETGLVRPSGRARSFEEVEPHPALRRYVDRFWTRSVAQAEGISARILPDGCIDLMVNLTAGGTVTAVGTMTRAATFEPRGPIELIAVRFRPGGAAPFLGVAADELTDRTVDATDAGCRWLEPVRFADCPRSGALRALENALLARLSSIAPPDPQVARGVAALFALAPPAISELARELGLSRQHLTRVFRRHVGVGPKQLGRVARLQRAVMKLQRGCSTDLASIAANLGYFDQAHMTNEFSELAGVTPRVAAGAPGSIFPIRSLFE